MDALFHPLNSLEATWTATGRAMQHRSASFPAGTLGINGDTVSYLRAAAVDLRTRLAQELNGRLGQASTQPAALRHDASVGGIVGLRALGQIDPGWDFGQATFNDHHYHRERWVGSVLQAPACAAPPLHGSLAWACFCLFLFLLDEINCLHTSCSAGMLGAGGCLRVRALVGGDASLAQKLRTRDMHRGLAWGRCAGTKCSRAAKQGPARGWTACHRSLQV